MKKINKLLLSVLIPTAMFSTISYAGNDCRGNNKEYGNVMKQDGQMMRRMSDAQKDRFFKAIDTDKNGKISIQEMENGRKKKYFIMRDTDGDGELSKREFFAFGRAKGNI